jgi:hypothetical protein
MQIDLAQQSRLAASVFIELKPIVCIRSREHEHVINGCGPCLVTMIIIPHI